MLDIIVVLIGALLAMLSVAVLAYPLMKSRSRGQPETPVVEVEEGIPELDSIYESIHTLQLEYGLGKVGETQYRQHMSDYRLLAAAALRRREQQQPDAALLLEQEVLLARSTLPGAVGNLAGDNFADGKSPGSSGGCPTCGVALDLETAECPECAAKPGLRGPDLP